MKISSCYMVFNTNLITRPLIKAYLYKYHIRYLLFSTSVLLILMYMDVSFEFICWYHIT